MACDRRSLDLLRKIPPTEQTLPNFNQFSRAYYDDRIRNCSHPYHQHRKKKPCNMEFMHQNEMKFSFKKKSRLKHTTNIR